MTDLTCIKRPPTIETLKGLLSYNHKTGVLTWRERPPEKFKTARDCSVWNARYAGKRAGTVASNGYVRVNIFNGMIVGAHRIAFAMFYGRWPADDIDHRNGDRADNRISNLRDVDRSANLRNAKRSSRNTTGVTGVSWSKAAGKWRAAITCDGKTKHLGVFDDFHDAVRARISAQKAAGFSDRHGCEG